MKNKRTQPHLHTTTHCFWAWTLRILVAVAPKPTGFGVLFHLELLTYDLLKSHFPHPGRENKTAGHNRQGPCRHQASKLLCRPPAAAEIRAWLNHFIQVKLQGANCKKNLYKHRYRNSLHHLNPSSVLPSLSSSRLYHPSISFFFCYCRIF